MLLDRVFGIGLNGDFHFRALLEGNLPTLLILQHVIDANLPVQMFGALNANLCFFWFARVWRLDDLFDRTRQGGTRLG